MTKLIFKKAGFYFISCKIISHLKAWCFNRKYVKSIKQPVNDENEFVRNNLNVSEHYLCLSDKNTSPSATKKLDEIGTQEFKLSKI